MQAECRNAQLCCRMCFVIACCLPISIGHVVFIPDHRREIIMRYKTFCRTGLFVSEICLGTMTFGGNDGMWRKIGSLQQDEAERLVGTAIDAGVNLIDTADVHSG